jgi:DNA-binding beta-propeller fold protein YncE
MSNTKVDDIKVNQNPLDLAFSPDVDMIYLINRNNDIVNAINITANK